MISLLRKEISSASIITGRRNLFSFSFVLLFSAGTYISGSSFSLFNLFALASRVSCSRRSLFQNYFCFVKFSVFLFSILLVLFYLKSAYNLKDLLIYIYQQTYIWLPTFKFLNWKIYLYIFISVEFLFIWLFYLFVLDLRSCILKIASFRWNECYKASHFSLKAVGALVTFFHFPFLKRESDRIWRGKWGIWKN